MAAMVGITLIEELARERLAGGLDQVGHLLRLAQHAVRFGKPPGCPIG